MDGYQSPNPPQFWIIGVVVVSVLTGITLFLAVIRANRRRRLVAVTLTPRRVESGFNRNLIIDQPPPPAYTQSPAPPVYPAETHNHTHLHHHHHTDTTNTLFMNTNLPASNF